MRSDDLHLASSRGHGETAVGRGCGEQLPRSVADLRAGHRLIARIDDSAGDGAGRLLRPAWRERQEEKQRQEDQEAVARARVGKNIGHVESRILRTNITV